MRRIGLKSNSITRLSILVLFIVYFAFSNNSLVKIGSQVFFLVCVGIKLVRSPRIRKFGYYSWAICWVGLCFISSIWAYNNSSAIVYSISVFEAVLFCALVLALYDKTDMELSWFETSILIAAFVMILVALKDTPLATLGRERFGERAGMHPNTVSNNLLFAEIIAFNRFINNKEKKSGFLYLALSFVYLFINFCTASKKGLFIGIVMPVVIWLSFDESISKKLRNILLAIIAGVAFFAIVSQFSDITSELLRRTSLFTSMFSGGSTEDMSTVGRLTLYQNAWQIFLNNPIWGVGLDGFRYANTGYMAGFYAHCNYTELLADLGCVGFCVYYSLLGSIVVRLTRLIRSGIRESIPYLGLCGAILLLDIAQVSYYNEITQMLIVYVYIFVERKRKIVIE